MSILITLLATLFVLGVLIFFHEFGHFWVARRFNVRVLKFSFGFGPEIFGIQKGETRYLISWVPLGGYVKLAGEESNDLTRKGEPWEFLSKPWWVRILTYFAGPFMNLILTFILSIIIGVVGVKMPDYPSVIGEIDLKSKVTELKTFEVGDRIIQIERTPVETWHQVTEEWRRLLRTNTDSVSIVLQRRGMSLEKKIHLSKENDWLSGISPALGTEIGSVSVGTPAYESGMSDGDRIISLNEKEVNTWREMRDIIYAHPNKLLKMVVERKGKKINISVIPMPVEMPGRGTVGVIGVSPPQISSYTVRLNFFASVVHGASYTLKMVEVTYSSLFRIVQHPMLIRQLGGAISIVQMSGAYAKKGISDLLNFMAMLSVMLTVVNLLPIPILDGGSIIFCSLEGIRRKPLKERTQALLQQIGLSILVALVVFTVLNDTWRLQARKTALKKGEKTGVNSNIKNLPPSAGSR